MMKNLLLFLILAVASACCPCRHLSTSTADSIRVETVVRYKRVLDTVYIDVPVEIVRETVRDTISHLETSFAASDARINPDGSLFHSLANKPQKRPEPIEKDVIYRDSIIYRDRVNTEIVEVERKLTWWQQTQIRGFWVTIIIILVLLRKKIFPLIRRFI